MYNRYIISGCFFAGLAVALGAFGAHGLENITDDDTILKGFRTGVQYQMYHALALLITGIIAERIDSVWVRRAAYSFITGIILFSGSLYLLTFLKIQESNAVRIAGPLTPVGGLFFIAGWLFLLVAVLSQKKKS
ncbi:MAG TPA: DUF423 domain-containing protein [Chitinophagaceae bacterium]|nr:DUF423 domain-containing protein [Chitinophagaceae bacterium]HPG11796.1 DUF423 domain-containing protein [Chitinophagaceae bacterium]